MKLISSPAKAWEEISMEEDRRKVYMAFVYPMIGLCGLSVFIGSLLTNGWGGPQSFQIAMTNCCAVAVALFGGYFLAAYAINEMGTRMFGLHSNMPLTQPMHILQTVAPMVYHCAYQTFASPSHLWRMLPENSLRTGLPLRHNNWS